MTSIGRRSPTVLFLLVGLVPVACDRPPEPSPPEGQRNREEQNRLEALERENRALREELVRLHLELAPEEAAIAVPHSSPVPEARDSSIPKATTAREEELREKVARLQRNLADLELLFEALEASYEMSEQERGRLAERIDFLLAEYERGR